MISRNAGTVAMGASTMLSRVSTLVNVGYGEGLHEEYIDEENGTLNKEGRDELIYFVRDKTELELDTILDKRYKTNMLNITVKNYLAE